MVYIREAMVHHAIIQKKVDELLAKGATKSSTDSADFSSNVHVVPKHTAGYDPFSTLYNLTNICTYLSLRCVLSDRYDNLFSKVIIYFHWS